MELIAQREREKDAVLRQQQASRSGSGSPRSQSASTATKFTDILDGREDANKPKDKFNRVRTPYSSGFLFTVQPETGGAGSAGGPKDGNDSAGGHSGHTRGAVMTTRNKEDGMGEGRQRLLKIMKDSGGVGAKGRNGAGKVTNPRAVTLSLSGRNKA